MGPRSRPLALTLLLAVLQLAAASGLPEGSSPLRSPTASMAESAQRLSGNLTAGAATPIRRKRVAVHGLGQDDDKEELLMAALQGAGAAVKGVRPPMHKVSLTQIGYIQFLRYIADVPELRELSFCVWLRSRNLTHNHPIFSYSKNEKERLARAWISPAGGHMPPRLHFTVMERPVLVEPLPEAAHRRWLHLCPSWDGRSGQYRLYVDGRTRRAGVRQEVTGITLPAGGDVVVGQEYTDFDKGLDDGVEGDVFGFYLFRTATPRGPSSAEQHDLDEDLQHQLLRTRRRGGFPEDSGGRGRAEELPAPRRRSGEAGDAMASASLMSSARVRRLQRTRPARLRYSLYSPGADFMRGVPQRVQRLYALCTEHLTPEDRAEAVIAWPATPVRVFGGAVVSNVNKGCGDF